MIQNKYRKGWNPVSSATCNILFESEYTGPPLSE